MRGGDHLILECEDLATSAPALHAARGAMADFFRDGYGHARVVRVWRGEVPPVPGDVAGVIVTGSSAMVADPLPWIDTTRGWLRGAIDAGVPVLGVCFGHQLLADMLGGTVAATPDGPEHGSIAVRRTPEGWADELTAALPDAFIAQPAHFQSVVVPPPGAAVLARSALAIQAIRYRSRVWGVQFHPEFTVKDMAEVIRNAADRLAAAGTDPTVLIEDIRPAEAAASVIGRFKAVSKEEAWA